MLRIFLLVLLTLVFTFGVSIGFYNAQPVRFSYIFGEVELPLIGLMVAEFFAAALLTLLVASARIFSLRAEVRRLRRELRDGEAELKNLRGLQLEPQRDDQRHV